MEESLKCVREGLEEGATIELDPIFVKNGNFLLKNIVHESLLSVETDMKFTLTEHPEVHTSYLINALPHSDGEPRQVVLSYNGRKLLDQDFGWDKHTPLSQFATHPVNFDTPSRTVQSDDGVKVDNLRRTGLKISAYYGANPTPQGGTLRAHQGTVVPKKNRENGHETLKKIVFETKDGFTWSVVNPTEPIKVDHEMVRNKEIEHAELHPNRYVKIVGMREKKFKLKATAYYENGCTAEGYFHGNDNALVPKITKKNDWLERIEFRTGEADGGKEFGDWVSWTEYQRDNSTWTDLKTPSQICLNDTYVDNKRGGNVRKTNF